MVLINNRMKNYTKTKTDRAWFSRLLQHLARKWSRSILITPEPTWGCTIKALYYNQKCAKYHCWHLRMHQYRAVIVKHKTSAIPCPHWMGLCTWQIQSLVNGRCTDLFSPSPQQQLRTVQNNFATPLQKNKRCTPEIQSTISASVSCGLLLCILWLV